MTVTSSLSIDIVRYAVRRTNGKPHQWIALGEIADNVYGRQDVVFGQAVELARCKGWIIEEGNPATRRACLTKAGCRQVLPAMAAPGSTASRQVLPTDSRPRRKRQRAMA